MRRRGDRMATNMEDESIYNLIPKPRKKKIKPKMYRSKFPGDLPPTSSTFGATTASQTLATNVAGSFSTPHGFKKHGATFGPTTSKNKTTPTNYLRRNSGIQDIPQPRRFSYTDNKRKDAVPKRGERPVMNLKTSKDYIKANAVVNILREPGKRAPSPTNEMPKHVEYGKVPDYLKHVKEEIQGEYDYINQLQEVENSRNHEDVQVALMPQEEKEKLLTALKLKWEAINHEYQAITHMVTLDTIGKVRRKEKYEADLQQLEKDIELLSKPLVYVK